MRITISQISFFLILSLIVGACYYDVEEELYPVDGCNVIEITYSENIVSILQENCYVCHSASAQQGGVVLEGYTELKKYVDSGQFLGAIKQESGFSPMPQGQPMLDDCIIQKLENWINEGAINN